VLRPDRPDQVIAVGSTRMPEGDVGSRKLRISIAFREPVTSETTVTIHPLFPPTGTPGVDYKPWPSTRLRPITFQPGQVQRTLTLTTYGNDTPGPGLSFTLYATFTPPGSGASFVGRSSIIDDDLSPPST
jgi:hypothetical protein